MNKLNFTKTLIASNAFDVLKKDISSGLGHAYMLVSPDADAISELFTLTAAAIYCKDGKPCLDCAICRAVLNGNHADIYRLNTGGSKIKVQDIKDLLEGVDVKALSDKKLYFIENADSMSPDAQNKLLKTLEEPPPGVTMFLGVRNPAGMLDTIKSRCRAVYLDLFGYDAIFEAIRSLGTDETTAGIAASCSEGLLGKAYKISHSPEHTALYLSATNTLKNLKKSEDVISVGGTAQITDNLTGFLDILAILLRDVLAANNGETIFSKHIANEIDEIKHSFSNRAAAESIMLITEARKKIALNVNAQASLERLLFSILEVKYKWQQ